MRILVTALLFSLGTLSGAFSAPWVTYEPPDGAARGQHVVFLAGDEEYRSEEALPMLAKILSQRHGFRCTVLFPVDKEGKIDPTVTDSLPGSEALESADAIVLALRFRTYPDEVMRRFEAALHRGVPLVALRTSTHAFNFPKDHPWSKWTWNNPQGGFGRQVLGETWVSHWGQHKKEGTKGVVEPGQESHPVLRGVEDVFGDSDVYEAAPPADARILMRGQVVAGLSASDPPAAPRRKKTAAGKEQDINDPMMPIVWTREVKNDAGTTNRVIVTTLGAATDLSSEGLRRLVVNAVFWGLGLDPPEKADVSYVGEYQPSDYSFGGYQKGVAPADHQLSR